MKINPKLNLNKTPSAVENGSLVLAKNIKVSADGQYLTNEEGLKIEVSIPDGERIVGVIPCNNELVIFTVKQSDDIDIIDPDYPDDPIIPEPDDPDEPVIPIEPVTIFRFTNHDEYSITVAYDAKEIIIYIISILSNIPTAPIVYSNDNWLKLNNNSILNYKSGEYITAIGIEDNDTNAYRTGTIKLTQIANNASNLLTLTVEQTNKIAIPSDVIFKFANSNDIDYNITIYSDTGLFSVDIISSIAGVSVKPELASPIDLWLRAGGISMQDDVTHRFRLSTTPELNTTGASRKTTITFNQGEGRESNTIRVHVTQLSTNS